MKAEAKAQASDLHQHASIRRQSGRLRHNDSYPECSIKTVLRSHQQPLSAPASDHQKQGTMQPRSNPSSPILY